MRKLNFLLTIFIGLLILSCSSEDNNVENTSIVGEWKLMRLNSSDIGDYHRDCNLSSRITFNNNSTFNSKGFTYDSAINDCFEENTNGNYIINNNELSLENNVFTFELTETEFSMSQIPSPSDGIKYTSYWERIN